MKLLGSTKSNITKNGKNVPHLEITEVILVDCKDIGKNISKSLSVKYSQKIPDHAKKSATDALKTSSKKVIQKTAKATGDLIGNKGLIRGFQKM